jgi:hypothetical protein
MRKKRRGKKGTIIWVASPGPDDPIFSEASG